MQQQLLSVPISMPYVSHGNSQQQQQQQQQFVYMQQQQPASISGYSYELNSSDNGQSSNQQQTRYSTQQPYPRQQQIHHQMSAPRDQGHGQRGSWQANGSRTDRSHSDSNSGNNSNSYQQQEDLYTPLDSNGEISSRSSISTQRPPEGSCTSIPPGCSCTSLESEANTLIFFYR